MEEFSDEVTHEHIINLLRDISGKIDSLQSGVRVGSPDGSFSSLEMGELFTAMAKSQAEMPFSMKYKENLFWSELYEDLPSLIQASRPSLTKNGLAVIQQILPNTDGASYLHTILAHSSGQWIKSVLRIVPPKDDIQSFKSHLDMLKRNAYSAIVGVVSLHDDDDGEASMENVRSELEKGTSIAHLYGKKSKFADTITSEQLEQIEEAIGEFTDIAQTILAKKKIQTLADLPKSDFSMILRQARRQSNLRKGLNN